MAASCFLAVATHFQLFLPICLARKVPRQRNFYELMGFKAAENAENVEIRLNSLRKMWDSREKVHF